MKRILYIGLVIFGFTVVSCQKQDIVPVASDSVEVPEWQKALSEDDSNDDDNPVVNHDDDNSGAITDPNNDPDGNKR